MQFLGISLFFWKSPATLFYGVQWSHIAKFEKYMSRPKFPKLVHQGTSCKKGFWEDSFFMLGEGPWNTVVTTVQASQEAYQWDRFIKSKVLGNSFMRKSKGETNIFSQEIGMCIGRDKLQTYDYNIPNPLSFLLFLYFLHYSMLTQTTYNFITSQTVSQDHFSFSYPVTLKLPVTFRAIPILL